MHTPHEAERPAQQSMQSTAKSCLSPGDAATHIGVSKSFLNKLRCAGGGPIFIKLGRRVVYTPGDLDAWLNARRRASTSDRGETV